jgi:predicted YcjX-like family ATPase
MKRAEVFATLKEANQIVDRMATVDENSKAYDDLSDALYYTLESITMGYHPWYSVLLSERTGHYYIKLSA